MCARAGPRGAGMVTCRSPAQAPPLSTQQSSRGGSIAHKTHAVHSTLSSRDSAVTWTLRMTVLVKNMEPSCRGCLRARGRAKPHWKGWLSSTFSDFPRSLCSRARLCSRAEVCRVEELAEGRGIFSGRGAAGLECGVGVRDHTGHAHRPNPPGVPLDHHGSRQGALPPSGPIAGYPNLSQRRRPLS